MPRPDYLIILISACALLGCATGNFHSDHTNPVYHQGGDQVKLPGVAQRVLGGSSERPSSGQNDSSAAVSGLLATGVLLALNRDYYQSSSIGGRLVCGTPLTGFEMPCPQVTVILKNAAGKELSRSSTDGGEFFFPVLKGKEYQLTVESARFQLSNNIKNLVRGDNVLVKLDPKSES